MGPYITFVVAGRHDDYGGNFLGRMQTFVNALTASWKGPGTDMELVIVEWNPAQHRPLLRDVLVWPGHLRHGSVRIIEVPCDVHDRIRSSENTPMFEYMAKNVGIMRSRGEYVLATNPDLLYSMELTRFLRSRTLSPGCFYRVNRYDVDVTVPMHTDLDGQLNFCGKHVSRVRVRGANIKLDPMPGKIAEVSYFVQMFSQRVASLLMKRDLKPYQIHTNASGISCSCCAIGGSLYVAIQSPLRLFILIAICV